MNFKAFHLFSELFIYISWFHIFNLHSFSFAVWEENYLKKDTFLLSLLCGKTLFVENQLSSRCLTSSTLKAKGPLKLKLLINYKKEIFRFRGWWSHRDPDPRHWKWRNCDQVISVEEKWRSGEGASDAQTVGFLPLWHHRRHHNSYRYHHHLDHHQQQCWSSSSSVFNNDRLIIIIAVYSWQWSNQETSNNQIQICYCVWILFVQSESWWQNYENRVQLRWGSCQFRASHNQIRCSGVRPHVYFYLNDFIQVCRSDV